MNFIFVENGNLDRSARKQIRSYVMKGRNRKPRPRGTRKRYLRDDDTSDDDVLVKSECHALTQALETAINSIFCTVGNSFSTLTFPYRMQPYMRELFCQSNHEPHPRRSLEVLLINTSGVYQWRGPVSNTAFSPTKG